MMVERRRVGTVCLLIAFLHSVSCHGGIYGTHVFKVLCCLSFGPSVFFFFGGGGEAVCDVYSSRGEEDEEGREGRSEHGGNATNPNGRKEGTRRGGSECLMCLCTVTVLF